MTQLKLLVVIIFAFVVAVFAVSNPQTVGIRFFGTEIISEAPLVIVVLGSVLAGVFFTAVLGFLYQNKLKSRISALNKENSRNRDKEEKLQLKIRELEERIEEITGEEPGSASPRPETPE